MNRRKIMRNRFKKQPLNGSQVINSNNLIAHEINLLITKAINGQESLKCVGEILLLSTLSGDAWLLDYVENQALRLVDNFQQIQFLDGEDFFNRDLEWDSNFSINDNTFISTKGNKTSIFLDYPIEQLNYALDFLNS